MDFHDRQVCDGSVCNCGGIAEPCNAPTLSHHSRLPVSVVNILINKPNNRKKIKRSLGHVVKTDLHEIIFESTLSKLT